MHLPVGWLAAFFCMWLTFQFVIWRTETLSLSARYTKQRNEWSTQKMLKAKPNCHGFRTHFAPKKQSINSLCCCYNVSAFALLHRCRPHWCRPIPVGPIVGSKASKRVSLLLLFLGLLPPMAHVQPRSGADTPTSLLCQHSFECGHFCGSHANCFKFSEPDNMLYVPSFISIKLP